MSIAVHEIVKPIAVLIAKLEIVGHRDGRLIADPWTFLLSANLLESQGAFVEVSLSRMYDDHELLDVVVTCELEHQSDQSHKDVKHPRMTQVVMLGGKARDFRQARSLTLQLGNLAGVKVLGGQSMATATDQAHCLNDAALMDAIEDRSAWQ
jgi:hypothetical protein